MMVTDPLWLSLVIILSLDLILTTLRSSFVHARPPQLLSLHESNPAAVDGALKLLEKTHFPATLRFNVSLTHFLLGVIIYLLLLKTRSLSAGLGSMVLAMLAATVVVLALEFAVEGVV
ncbi:MAG: hypothetical protein U1B80_02055, partial [Anaerolineaceae bacterium]|nr:hypothetical protein [Anaerolineaceae bacterium]